MLKILMRHGAAILGFVAGLMVASSLLGIDSLPDHGLLGMLGGIAIFIVALRHPRVQVKPPTFEVSRRSDGKEQ